MTTDLSKQRLFRVLAILCGLIAIAVVGVMTKDRWLPMVLQANSDGDHSSSGSHEGHDHAEHGHEGHDRAGHEESSSLHLSIQARRNIGLTEDKLQLVKFGMFTRTLNIPARVVELPGRTKVQVASPMTGVVTSVHAIQGEAVLPGALLFTVRLTHEDLVQAQAAFLKTLGELDVEDREIARLTGLDTSGVIAGKTLLARKYSKQKLQAVLNAHRETLLLHGLSLKQVDEIVSNRHLLRELEVSAPALPFHYPIRNTEPDPQTSAIRAGKERLAPVLMTALTSGIGLVPLALSAGEPGKEILYPVATVILGGLINSTILEFFVRPALFWTFGLGAARRIVKAGLEHVELEEEEVGP